MIEREKERKIQKKKRNPLNIHLSFIFIFIAGCLFIRGDNLNLLKPVKKKGMFAMHYDFILFLSFVCCLFLIQSITLNVLFNYFSCE